MQWLDPVEIPDEGEANRALDNAYLDPEAFMVTLDNYFEIRGSGIMTRRAASTTCYVGECELGREHTADHNLSPRATTTPDFRPCVRHFTGVAGSSGR